IAQPGRQWQMTNLKWKMENVLLLSRASPHFAAGSKLIDSVHHHLLAVGESLVNRSLSPFDYSNGYLPHIDSLIRFHDVDECPLRATLDCDGGDQDFILFHFHQ